MRTDLIALLHRLNQLIGQILRMRSHKADALKSLDLIDTAKKLSKRHRIFQVLSVGVDVLTEKHDLDNAICNETADLCENLLRLTASLTSTHIRNDAVTAKVVTAKHDVDSGLERIFALHRKILDDLLRFLLNVDDHLLAGQTIVHDLCEFIDVVSSKNEIHKRIALLDLLDNRRLLHHTATQTDQHRRILFLD